MLTPCLPQIATGIWHRNRLMSDCVAAVFNQTEAFRCQVLAVPNATLDETISQVDALDLVLLEARSDDVGATQRIADAIWARFINCKIVLMIALDGVERMLDFARIMNHGCVFEGVGFSDMQLAVQTVLAGDFYCSPFLANALMSQVRIIDQGSSTLKESCVNTLTLREREVLELIKSERLGNKQIARRLGISLSTVKNHVHNIIEKLRVQDRHEAVLMTKGPSVPFADRPPRQESMMSPLPR